MKMRWISLLLLSVLTISLYGQQPPGKGKSTIYPATPINPVGPKPPLMPMPLIMPLFLEGNYFTSTLTLVNNSTVNTYADVTLRALNGSSIAIRRVNFEPHSQQQVHIGELLAKKGSSAAAGSIIVEQSPALQGPSIAGALQMTNSSPSDPNYIDEEISMPSEMGSNLLRGVADRMHGSPVVAISSLSDMVQHVKAECLGEHGKDFTRTIELPAGATIIADVCARADDQDGDFHEILEKMDETKNGPRGIQLTSDAMAGSFAAFALAPHGRKNDRYFSSVLFTDPKTVSSSNIVFPGVPVGSSALLPDGIYTPHISMTNFSTSEIHVHVIFAQTSANEPQAHEVGSLTVPPGSSRELILKDLGGDDKLQNSFMVDSDGPPGALAAKLISSSDSRLHEVELQAKDEFDANNSGMHPWTIEQSTESTLLLFNHSGTAQFFDVSIAGGGVDWYKPYKLAPMQTKAISIRELIEDQVKDQKGNVLPTGTESGEVNWMVVNANKGSGRLLQSDRSTGMARNYSCGYSGLLCGSEEMNYEETFSDGTTVDYAFIGPLTCTSGQPQFCSGQQTGNSGSFNYQWSSRTPTIASISGSSVTANVNLLGVSVGTSTIQSRISSASCSSGGTTPATVVKCPSSITLNTLQQINISTDSSLHTGYGAMASMLANPTSTDWTSAVITETVTPGANNCPAALQNAFQTVTSANSSTFNVGKGGHVLDPNSSQTFPAVPNAFYDEHSLTSTSNTLPSGTCQASAVQTYVCGGTTIGTFNITKTVTAGTANGGPSSIVSVTKQ